MRGCIIRCFPLRTSAVSGFSFSVSKDFPSSISLHAHRGGRGREPPILAVTCPAHPYKSAIEN
jgi:hypothetical protein